MHFGQATVAPKQREQTKVTSYMTSYPPDLRQPPSFSEYSNPISDPKPTGEKSDGQGLPKIG